MFRLLGGRGGAVLSSSLFDSWSLKEAATYGKKYRAICRANYSYDSALTLNKIYEIEVVKPILALSPLCKFMGDNGLEGMCHLTRFIKIEEIEK